MKQHYKGTLLIDYLGVAMNILILPLGTFAFIYLFAQRLDGDNQINYFVLFIPVWLTIIPCFAYIVLNGIAAQNTRISKFEKIILSVLVPCK